MQTSVCDCYAASWRRLRRVKEGFHDIANCKLNDQTRMLISAQDQLRLRNRRQKAELDRLCEERESLKDDLRDKTCGLNVDISCLTSVDPLTDVGVNKTRGGKHGLGYR